MYVKVIRKLQMIVNLFLETNKKDKKTSIMDQLNPLEEQPNTLFKIYN